MMSQADFMAAGTAIVAALVPFPAGALCKEEIVFPPGILCGHEWSCTRRSMKRKVREMPLE